jgi:hypothetical protein
MIYLLTALKLHFAALRIHGELAKMHAAAGGDAHTARSGIPEIKI